VISLSVCLSVCLFVSLSACIYVKPHVEISLNFLYTLPVALARSCFDNSAIRYVLPVFLGDVMFSHNKKFEVMLEN